MTNVPVRKQDDAASSSKETTPAALTADIEALCGRLEGGPPGFVPVEPIDGAQVGWCFRNVEHAIAAGGGAGVFGWTIWEYPSLYLTAEFHACWRAPHGGIVDVTPKPDGERRILFASDPRYPENFNFFTRPNNVRASLYKPVVMDVAAAIERLTPPQMRYESGRAQAKGISLGEWLAS